ncbi:MAG: Flp pilus assembly protein CpaB [Candidatus Omnitrophica bacterium]|nr:Flp pilus assembly protein CpaB [Candidatus Omnitrophota bacterium]
MLNIENKKQILTIAFAAGLGLVAVLWTGQVVKESVQKQTSLLKKDFENKLQKQLNEQDEALASQLEKAKQEMKAQMASQMKRLAEETAKNMRNQGAGGSEKSAKVVPMQAFALQTPPGKRAVTIMIDPLSAVGGLVSPGDFVDVISRLEIPNPQAPKDKNDMTYVTTVLFQNVQVLAVGTNFKAVGASVEYGAQQNAKQLYVTLALSPEEAGLITFAQTHGTLKFALRAPSSDETPNLQVASWDTLSDYLLQKQGTEFSIPRGKAAIKAVGPEQVKSVIQVFKSGQDETK